MKVRDGEAQTLLLLLSRLSWPAPNKILLAVQATKDGTVSVAMGAGEYDPLGSSPRVKSHREILECTVQKGQNLIEVEIPWLEAELVAYPTNFRKTITGRQFNQYHFIHVDTLAKIVDETDSDILRYYLDRWADYPSKWPGMTAYRDSRLTLERFDPKKHS